MKEMTKQDLQTILHFEDTNAALPLKVRVDYPDGTYEMCAITGFHQWNDCFQLLIHQKSLCDIATELPGTKGERK